MTPTAPLPRGTVALLFTDIEGSTRLLERLGDKYGAVLQRHRDLLAHAFAAHGGVVVDTEGDALFAAFDRPTAAVAAAVDGQRAILAEAWPPGGRVRVRMGLHCGEVEASGRRYVGMTVHVGARVASAAHGGQIIVTDVTARLAGNPDTVDLGRHRLKDVGEFRLLQLRAPGLEESFPAPRTLSALPNNLPAPVDSFIGRQIELAEIARAIRADRLVTLTGPGGSGKTRLALEVAASLVPAFGDGVWFAALATITDGTRLFETVAQVLRVSDIAGEAIADTLEGWLSDRDLLLILDNCEHVVEDVRSLCERLLPACSRLRILATSREFLDVRGEHAIQTPPLAVPDDLALAPLSDAVQLFLTRAEAGAPSFRPDDADLGTVMQVCRRLDGLPLAIELAAVRLRAMPLSQLASRLDHQFWRLTGGGHAEIPRQRTLETVVAWSYDLLTEAEQHALARLAVFPDHFTLEMAEAVISDPPIAEPDVVDIAAEAEDLLRRTGHPMGVAHAAEARGIIAFESGELAQAAASVTDAIDLFASYGNVGCTAHALEAAAVVIAAPGHPDAGVAIELLGAADELRRQSGQGHRPWEIRARLGNLEDRIVAPGVPASAAAQAGRVYSLASAASLATGALRSLTTSTTS